MTRSNFLIAPLWLLILSSHAQNSPCFNTIPAVSMFPVDGSPTDIITADFNSDGKIDMATCNDVQERVGVYLATGTGSFSAATYYNIGNNTGNDPQQLTTADFNVDGNPDIAVVCETYFSVLMGSASGTFAAKINYGNFTSSNAITVIDANADGKPDLFISEAYSGTIHLFLNLGTGTFASSASYNAVSFPGRAVSADFNNDGKGDIAVTNAGSDNISVFLAGNSGTFATAVNYSVGTNPWEIVSMDFNNDGNKDLAVTCYTTSGPGFSFVSVLLGSSTGTFSAPQTFPVGLTPKGLTSGDFNNDGNMDLAANCISSMDISVLLGTGTGSFSPMVTYMGGNGRSVKCADFDNDGKADLAAIDDWQYVIRIFRGDGSGGFLAARNYWSFFVPGFGLSQDFNNDGAPDLVTSNITSDNVSLLLNNGNAVFAPALTFAVGSNPEHLVSNDFNGDTYKDLAVCNYSSGNVTVLLSTGTGSFLPAANFSAGLNPYDVVSNDFNNDGSADLAVSNYNSASVSLLFGNGSGSFSAPVSITTAPVPVSIVSADFNADGKPDLAVASFTSSIVQVFIGTGTGSFASPVAYTVGALPIDLVYGDFNGDGFTDLISGSSITTFPVIRTVSFLAGSISGTFSPAVNYNTTYNARSCVAKDMNSDGNLDLFILYDGPVGEVYLGTGASPGMFSQSYKYNLSSGDVFEPICADFNSDGRMDFAIDNTNSMNVSVILGGASPTITISGGSTPTCGGIPVNLVASGGLSYHWNTGQANASIAPSPTVTATYTVTGLNGYGCASTAVKTVSVLPSPSVTLNSGVTCQGSSFTIAPGSTAGYTFQNGAAVVSPTANTVYSVVATGTNGCTTNKTATVAVQGLPLISATQSRTLLCMGDTALLKASGGFNYVWSNGITTFSTIITATTNPATYTVTGTFLAGCQNTASVTFSVQNTPTVSVVSSASVLCLGQTVTFTASGAQSYTWNTSQTTSVIAANPSITKSYTVTGTSGVNSCKSSAVSSVTVNALPTVTVNSGAICVGNSFTLAPGGASTYSYSGGNVIVSPTVTTTYTITGTNSVNSCSAAVISSITVNALPAISVNSGVICLGDPFTFAPGGATTYSYSGGNAIVSPTVTSNYTVTGTDSVTSCSASAVSSITVNALPTVSVNSGAICFGNSFTLAPGGATTYSYSTGNAIVSPTITSTFTVTGIDGVTSCSSSVISSVTVNALPTVSVNSGAICLGDSFTFAPGGALTYTISGGTLTVTPTVNTSYSVSGTNTQGCVSANTAVGSITVNALPPVSVNSGAICFGNSFTLAPGGATTYSYSGGNAIVSPTITSTYTVTGFNSVTSCSSSAVSSVSVNALPSVSVNSGAICLGNSFTIVPAGANTYTISGGSLTVTPISNTSYSITGASAQGCMSANAAVSSVTVNALPTVSVNSGAICLGNSFTIVPGGANSYTVSGGSLTVTPTSNTSYSITGTNAQGCLSANTAVSSVTVNALPTVSVNNGAICLGNSFTIVPGGANTYTISGGSLTVTPIYNASYSITGTNAQGCLSPNAAVSSVTVHSLPVVNATSTASVMCVGESAGLTASGAVSYTWSTNQTTAVIMISPTIGTSYTVTGTDANGCKNASAFTLSVSTCDGIVLQKDEEPLDMILYPNPNNGSFNVELPVGSKITVVDLLGNEIYEQQLLSGKHAINLSECNNGLYLLRAENKNKIRTFKVVKDQ